MFKIRNIKIPKKSNGKSAIASALAYFFKSEYNQTSKSNLKNYLGEGVWLGGLADHLGMSGDAVKLGDFECISSSVNPKTGEQFAKKNKGKAEYDFMEPTLSAPKDFSILAFLDDDLSYLTYIKMLNSAYSKTMDFIADKAVSRGNSNNDLVKCPNLLYACFMHETSRPTIHPETKEVILPDMQIHLHTILSKYIQDLQGQVRTIQRKFLFVNQKEIGTFFRAELANEMRNVGYEIVPHEEIIKTDSGAMDKIKSWKVAGITDEQRATFSKRKVEIERIAKELGINSMAGKSKIAQKFKASKVKFDREELIMKWKQDGKLVGINQDFIQSLKSFRLDSMHSLLKTDEEIILSAVNFYKGKEYLTEKNITEKLYEYSQYVPIDVKEKFKQFLDDGLIKKVGKFNYIATFNKIEKTPKQVKFYEIKERVRPQKFLKDYFVSNGVDVGNQNFKYLNFLDVNSQQATITPNMIKEYQASEERKESSVISSTSNTIESLYASLDVLENKLRLSKLSIDEASRIQAQIKAIHMQIQELEKRKKNAPKPQ